MKTFKNFLKQILDHMGYSVFKNSSLLPGVDVRKFIRGKTEVKIIFDIGANIGQTSNYFNEIFPKSAIYAFEPVKSTFDKLKANVGNNIKCFNLALGETEKATIMYLKQKSVTNSLYAEINKPQGYGKEEVQVTTVDRFCERSKIEHIDILKTDTEGYDLNVLKGAENILKNGNVKFIFTEVTLDDQNIKNTQFSEVDMFLKKLNYRLVGFFDQSFYPGSSHMDYCNALYGRNN